MSELFRFRVLVVNTTTGELGMDEEITAPMIRTPDGGAPDQATILSYGRMMARKHITGLAQRDSTYIRLRGVQWDMQVMLLT